MWWSHVCMYYSLYINMVLVDNISNHKEANHTDGLLCWNCSWELVFKLLWLRGRCDWLKVVLISSQGWCKACRARLNASNPGCFTENNPGTAASAPGSCAGADFKETAGPKFSPKPSSCLQTVKQRCAGRHVAQNDLYRYVEWEMTRKSSYSQRSFILISLGYSHFSHFPRDNSPKSAQNRKNGHLKG